LIASVAIASPKLISTQTSSKKNSSCAWKHAFDLLIGQAH
jgi:hypothetical protein